MNIPTILVSQFTQLRPLVEELAKRVRDTLTKYCEDNGFAFTSRIKTLESLAEKIETGRFQAWSEINDLFACTIIVPTLAEEQEAINFCRRTFDVVEPIAQRGRQPKAPDVFVFDATRIRARLVPPQGQVSGSVSIFDILFEIQIKSAFEHAWSVCTHDLTYKAPYVDWRRFRVAAQMKAIVEQLDSLILGFERGVETVPESPWPALARKRLMAAKVTELFDQGFLPSDAKPKDLSRFCNNLYSLLESTGREANTEQALAIVEDTVRATRPYMVPKSISLLQYVLGILLDKGFISGEFENYHCHITPELRALFPNLPAISQAFDYAS